MIVAIKSILQHATPIDSQVTVQGWLRSRRSSKGGFSFLHIHDGSCFGTVQAIADQALSNYDAIVDSGTGCSVTVTGKLVASQGKGQDREIQADEVIIHGLVDDPESYPISKKQHSFEYLRGVAHLRPRTNTFGAMTRVRHALSAQVHEFFDRNGFFWVNTPIITASDCEGAGDMFRVSTLDMIHRDQDGGPSQADPFKQDFFGSEAFLTVSGQLNLESFACSMGKVYTFGPTFRAENSNTSRHLAEFWMIEPEVAFADLAANADLAERFLSEVIQGVLERCPDDMAFFEERGDEGLIERLTKVCQQTFTRMTYSEAVNLLLETKHTFEFPVTWGADLQSEHERFITEQIIKAPVVVTDYPKDIKAFYMRLNEDEKTVAAMDVLVPGVGEIIGGSQREERLSVLDARMDPRLADELWWYRDLRRYGSVPHAGFGLGLERLLLYITGMDNIRDAIPFPRVPGNASF
ncbi:asparagine--tRNA ligase [Pseudomonadales bacterium]|jgi:asparaginyl-tRNA synthetase|nr:asparagine--tRNA ligase [Pseudomonadales bacterium]